MSNLLTLPTNAIEAPQGSAEVGGSIENGDVFIADTNEYIGKWEGPMVRLPVEMCMVVDNYEYVYKLDRRENRVDDVTSGE